MAYLADPLRILPAATKPPAFVTRNDAVSRAITLMAQFNYSQLPVMAKQEARKVDGLITWRSIGMAQTFGHPAELVSDCLVSEVEILDADYPLLDALPIVIAKDVILVRDRQRGNVISGLVTLTDVAEDYYLKSGPFMVLGQIEHCIRELIEGKFTVEELQAVKFGDDAREVHSPSDLTFSEYIQLLRKGDHWSRLDLNLDKDAFTRNLDQIREIRNEVMHFSSEPLGEAEHERLANTLRFLKQLVGMG